MIDNELQEVKRIVYMFKAIEFLQARGKVQGTDFINENAVDMANRIAFEEERDRKLEDITLHGPISFDGQNCERPCNGWNGESRRCDCGNRRVYWTVGDGHSFLEPYVYGEAY